MKAFFNTFVIAAVSLFLCAAAPARPFQEPEKDKQQEPEKQKPEEQPKPEKERSADAERKPQQQEEKKPNEERKPEPNRQPQENQQERDRAAHQDNNRQEHADGKLSERTGRHNSFRIPDDRFRAGFGSGHRFHVRRGEREFGFGGFRFEFVDPWPAAWSYDDDCYIEFIDGEYYLVDAIHPGVRVLVIVVS